MKRKVKFGAVGASAMGLLHIQAIARHPELHWSPETHGTALSRQSSAPDSHPDPRNEPQCIQYPLHASALAFSPGKSASCKSRFVHETCMVRQRIFVPCCWPQILSSNGCHRLSWDSAIPGHSPGPIRHLSRASLRRMVSRSFYTALHICCMFSPLSPADLRASASLP